VLLDADLAGLYGVQTFRLNEAVKRNQDRFPEDFLFQLTAEERDSLTSQFAISKQRGCCSLPGEAKDRSKLTDSLLRHIPINMILPPATSPFSAFSAVKPLRPLRFFAAKIPDPK
jgi:hypothetical protein